MESSRQPMPAPHRQWQHAIYQDFLLQGPHPASRCQRLIASGNTRFIKTSCCKDMIEEAEERSGYEAAVQQDAEINSYEDVREEEKQISDGGCIRKCYFKKNAKADAEQIDCDELGRY